MSTEKPYFVLLRERNEALAEINRLRSAIEDVLMRREDCICAFARKRLGEALQGEEEP